MILLYLLTKTFTQPLFFHSKLREKTLSADSKKYNSKCLYFDSSHKYSSKVYNFLTIQNDLR